MHELVCLYVNGLYIYIIYKYTHTFTVLQMNSAFYWACHFQIFKVSSLNPLRHLQPSPIHGPEEAMINAIEIY